MGPSVAIRLNNREMQLRYGLRNSRLAVSTLQASMPQRAEKLTIGDAAMLLLRQDQDAVLSFMVYGLRAGLDNEKLSFDQVERWLERELENDREMSDFSLPALEALKLAKIITLNYTGKVQDHDDGAKQELGSFIDDDRDPLRHGAGRPLAVSHGGTSQE